MPRRFEIEVCVDRLQDAVDSLAAGATRIEMNYALELSGLTPSPGSCQWLKANCDAPVVAMLRPHNRGFLYTAAEQSMLLRDCETLLATGIDGVVFGALTEKGLLDMNLIGQVARMVGDREMIVHRAFDELPDQRVGLQQLIECGVDRVLTSGGAATAEAGVDRLRELVDLSAGRIEILPGGGITAGNAVALVRQTGCDQIHGSFRLSARPGAVPDLDNIRRTRQLLDSCSA